MSHRITLTMVALLAAGPALAGGFATPVVVPAPAQPVVVPVTPVVVSNDWSGGYAGAQLGFGRLSIDETNTATKDVIEDLADGSGALFGVHAGYMFDFGRFVAGAEVDYDRTQISIDGDPDLFGGEFQLGEIDSIARAKLRLGFDAGRVLPYVAAGLARASVSFDEGLEADVGPLEDTYDGRFVGIGANFMVSDRFMVGVEALRHNFDNLPDNEEGVPADDIEDDAIINTITLRGSFRF